VLIAKATPAVVKNRFSAALWLVTAIAAVSPSANAD
jgi:hypothetical protein